MVNDLAPGPFDAIVIGAGMVGAASALFLSEHGRRVALVDAATAGKGTSNNTFAWINATSKTSNEAYHRLNALGAAGYRALVKRWGEARVGVHPSGMLQWGAPDDAITLAALDARYEQLVAFGYPVAKVGYHELQALEPHVSFPVDARGLHAIADAWLDVPVFIEFAKTQVQQAGGLVFEDCQAQELQLAEDGTIEGVRTTGGLLSAPQVLVATGPGTPQVLEDLTGYEPFRTRFPMQQAPGLLVRTPPITAWHFARRILYSGQAQAVHIRPTPDGGLLLGADDTDGAAQHPSDSDGVRAAATILLQRAHDLIPKFPGPSLLDQCELKIGVRPMPSDGHSIAGSLPGSDSLFVALTHSGVTLAPAIGRLLAQQMTTGERPLELDPFTFDRFQTP
jgi:glycine/D-amino acid oxidase-like deaminating enzyme